MTKYWLHLSALQKNKWISKYVNKNKDKKFKHKNLTGDEE